MINMSVNYMGLILKNPVIASSCGLSSNIEGVKRLSDAGVGAIVLKSLFEEQILTDYQYLGNPTLLNGHATELDYIREIPMTLRLDEYLRMIEKSKEEVPVPIIASVNCISASKWTEYTKYIEAVGADGIELNISITPDKLDEEPSIIEKHVCDIVSMVKHNVNIPLAIKLGPYYTSIPRITKKVRENGASALVLFNRFYHPDFDINSLEYKSKNRYSSRDEMYHTLRWMSILYRKTDCTLVANSGIHDGEDLVKQLLAGASAVQVASTLYINGLGQVKSMLQFLQKWMISHEYRNIDEFRGIIHQKNSNQPDYFQRQQYIRALVGID
jgi:dihydroorotate dehydrogenase (fumarate)